MWACMRPLQSAHAAAELVCRGLVVVLVCYVMSTAAVGHVIRSTRLLYNSIAQMLRVYSMLPSILGVSSMLRTRSAESIRVLAA